MFWMQLGSTPLKLTMFWKIFLISFCLIHSETNAYKDKLIHAQIVSVFIELRILCYSNQKL